MHIHIHYIYFHQVLPFTGHSISINPYTAHHTNSETRSVCTCELQLKCDAQKASLANKFNVFICIPSIDSIVLCSASVLIWCDICHRWLGRVPGREHSFVCLSRRIGVVFVVGHASASIEYGVRRCAYLVVVAPYINPYNHYRLAVRFDLIWSSYSILLGADDWWTTYRE